jgi:hypothetical protein
MGTKQWQYNQNAFTYGQNKTNRASQSQDKADQKIQDNEKEMQQT